MNILYFAVFLAMACTQNQSKLPTREEMEAIDKNHQKVLQQALNWKVVREFREIFPTQTIGLSQYGVPSVKHTVFGEVGLSSRYILHFSVSLKLDKTWTKIVEFGAPEFQLNEVESIEVENSRFHVTYADGSQRRFGQKEWKLLYKARGDFSVLGISLITDRPVPLFDAYWNKVASGWYPAL